MLLSSKWSLLWVLHLFDERYSYSRMIQPLVMIGSRGPIELGQFGSWECLSVPLLAFVCQKRILRYKSACMIRAPIMF